MLFCGVMGHNDANCGNSQGMNFGMEEMNYMGGFEKPQPMNDPFSHTYNPGWQNHQARPMGPPEFQPRQPFQQYLPSPPPHQDVQEKKALLEDLVMQNMSKIDAKVDQIVQTQQATIQNLKAGWSTS